MEQILALEVDFCPAKFTGKALRKIEGSGSADKIMEQVGQFTPKGRILAGGCIFALQFQKSRHEGFGNKAAAVRAEVAMLVGQAREIRCRRGHQFGLSPELWMENNRFATAPIALRCGEGMGILFNSSIENPRR